MSARRYLLFAMLCAIPLFMLASRKAPADPNNGLTPIEQLGKFLFLDTNLSTPHGQSCAACHGADVGFTGPISSIRGGPSAIL